MTSGRSGSGITDDPQSFDSFALDYDRFCDFDDKPAWAWMHDAGVPSGGRVLDAGCGAGRRCLEFAEHFDEVVGIDLSAPLLEVARSRRSHPRITYLTADLTTFADERGFDVVFSHTTLHHVPDLEQALLNLRDLVRPGGWIVLVDCVASRPAIPKWIFRVGAVLSLPSDVRRHGWRNAAWLLCFRATGPWLAHLASDRYLSPVEFEERYGAVLEGARIDRHHGFGRVMWLRPRVPSDPSTTR